jgi:hypothetical protein
MLDGRVYVSQREEVWRVVLCAVLLLWGAVAGAEPAVAPRQRLTLSSVLIGRYYPIGADLQGRLAFTQRMGDSEELLWRTRFWRVEGSATYNPASWSVGLAADFEPIAVFQLRAALEHRGYFGSFGTLVSSARPEMEYSDAALEAAAGRGEHYATGGQTVWLQPTLQAQVGPLGIRSTFSASFGRMVVRPGHTLFYEPSQDLLLPASGFTLGNTATVAYLGGSWVAGAIHSWISPLGLGPQNQVHRLGILATYTFQDRPEVFVSKPTLLALALFNLQHRGRQGPIPTVVLGFSIESDLLRSRD